MGLIVDFPQHDSPWNTAPPRRVIFATHTEAKFVENLSLKCKADLWFSIQELESFKSGMARDIRRILSSGMTVADYAEMNVHDTSAFMGLENYFFQNTRQNIRNRRGSVWEVVLSEQQRQLDVGVHDPESMAAIAEAASEKSRKRARIIGLLHAPGKC
mmetsp:Transcript_27024/g.56305  ORF Transcript_27024/g.56305 Transcript_27024/m.56305 type:complete len:158 (+) Transcript_27024:131-604(+)